LASLHLKGLDMARLLGGGRSDQGVGSRSLTQDSMPTRPPTIFESPASHFEWPIRSVAISHSIRLI